ncbi:cation diffusion facilitator family transporter [Cytobacillus spongiae]|uniref:cation diffusion facilitator family transporter n=1 Tax=Cytobacillus spongiae TaxID=2901381 RepID=UPI001F1E9A0F|nr:cation diffusion facilitator family transporter [Cytobacillus spongiae]UII55855.1 cation diffusion facilitator family transporter [Cytobacillus spongiae]
MDEQRFQELKLGERGAIISIIAYICLSTLKLVVAKASHSEALWADGLNNLTDILAASAVWIGLRYSQKPADENHPYGHWKSEMVASMVASFIMIAVGFQVLSHAIISTFDGVSQTPDTISAWVGLFSAAVMFIVYLYNKKLAQQIKSSSVLAAAKDNLSDAWVSIGTAIGIFGSQFHFPWLDPITAAIVGALICKTGWGIFREATLQLTDGFDQNVLKKYMKTALQIEGIKRIKNLKARSYGNHIVVDLVIAVNANLDIKDAHDISTILEKKLKNEYHIYDVHVHIEPYESHLAYNMDSKLER